MAPNSTGHKKTDNLQIMALVEALRLCYKIFETRWVFCAKVLDAGQAQRFKDWLTKI